MTIVVTTSCHHYVGKPILSAIGDERQLAIASVVFCVIFYFPGDLVFSLITITPLYAFVCVAKEVQRGLKVLKGVKEGVAFNPESVLVPLLIGTIKGNGAGFLTPFTRAMRGAASGNELLKPSVTTKSCLLLASGLFFLDSNLNDLAYIGAVGLFISVKLAVVFVDPVDPFVPLENAVMSVVKAILRDGSETAKTKPDKKLDKKSD